MEAELEQAIDRTREQEGDLAALADRINQFWQNTNLPVVIPQIQGQRELY